MSASPPGHGCTIASHCLVGIGAIVLGGAELGLIAAGSLVPLGMKVPARAEDLDPIRRSARGYIALQNDSMAGADA